MHKVKFKNTPVTAISRSIVTDLVCTPAKKIQPKSRVTPPPHVVFSDGPCGAETEVWLIYAGIVVAMFGVFGLMLFLACQDTM